MCNHLAAAFLALLLARAAGAQATRVVADTQDFLLRVTQHWGRESPLGALADRQVGPDDIELRLWQGYGLGGSWGTVLRRAGGRWRAWQARVVTCTFSLPIPVGDTLTAPSVAGYRRLARRRCGERRAGEADAPPGTYGWTVITDDTVSLTPVGEGAPLADLWADLVRAGVTGLPTRVPRSWVMMDGHTYVVEVRRGGEYRASVIEHTAPPATAVDRAVQAVAALVGRLPRAAR